MQKEHSQNIQELLDETNQRLKKIENEYLQKIESMVSKTQVFFDHVNFTCEYSVLFLQLCAYLLESILS